MIGDNFLHMIENLKLSMPSLNIVNAIIITVSIEIDKLAVNIYSE